MNEQEMQARIEDEFKKHGMAGVVEIAAIAAISSIAGTKLERDVALQALRVYRKAVIASTVITVAEIKTKTKFRVGYILADLGKVAQDKLPSEMDKLNNLVEELFKEFSDAADA